MEGPSNGGLLYHEVQEGKLCAVHCVNTVLQGPYFSEFDLAALASDLDSQERQVLAAADLPPPSDQGDFLSERSHNVSVEGNFSIQVLQKALGVWDLEVVPLDAPALEESKFDPAERENAFICHMEDHWFCIRKVNGEWYNFNSLYPAPEHLSKFYLSAYIDSLKASGWTIFTVKGNFPKECNISAESGGFGQWLTPDDAKNITSSCSKQQTTSAADVEKQQMDMLLARSEDEDLNAAILASLLDASNSAGHGTHLSGTGEGSGTSKEEKATESSITTGKDNTEQEPASTGNPDNTEKKEDDPNVHG